jgi:drug/metabolite transporter (DMT)-like permease
MVKNPAINFHQMQRTDYMLYAGVVFSWSFSWYALILQLGVVAPEVSLIWRYLLASTMMFIWVVLSKRPIKFPIKTHGIFIILGLCMFSANFYCFYQAGSYLVSGFLSVMFSLASIVNLGLGVLFFRQFPSMRMVFGAMLGVVGVALMFSSQILETGIHGDAVKGLVWCVAGVLFFCTGNQVATKLQGQNVPMRSMTAWGMVYGTLISLCFTLSYSGAEIKLEWSSRYIVSLLYLAAISSVMAFACYLELLSRIGAGRAAYATVLFPIAALIVSTIMEDYHWQFNAILGVMLALLGNYFVIRPSKKKRSFI